MTDLFNFVVNTIKQGNYTLLFYMLLILLFMWLYKEFKNHLNELTKSNKGKIEKAIEIYSQILFTIINIENGKNDSSKLDEYLPKAYALLPKNILKKIYKWKNNEQINLLEIKEELNYEIMRLKYKQNSITTFNNEESIIQSMLYSLENIINSFIYPLFYAFSFIVIILLFIFFMLTINTIETTYDKIIFIIVMVNIPFKLLLLMIILDFTLKKQYVHNIINYLSIIFLVILPTIACFFKTLPKHFVFIDLFLFIIYIIVFFKKSINKS